MTSYCPKLKTWVSMFFIYIEYALKTLFLLYFTSYFRSSVQTKTHLHNYKYYENYWKLLILVQKCADEHNLHNYVIFLLHRKFNVYYLLCHCAICFHGMSLTRLTKNETHKATNPVVASSNFCTATQSMIIDIHVQLCFLLSLN